MRKDADIKEAQSLTELLSHQERQQATKLYVTKLVNIIYFLARNKLVVEEMYPQMILFLMNEMEVPILRQYLESLAKSATYESSGTCD